MPYVPILSRFALVFSRLCSGSISGKSFEHLSTNLHKEATGTIQDKKNYREGLLFLLFLVLLL